MHNVKMIAVKIWCLLDFLAGEQRTKFEISISGTAIPSSPPPVAACVICVVTCSQGHAIAAEICWWCAVQYETASGTGSASWKSMPTGYPMLTFMDEDAVRANVTVRVPRDADAGERLTVMTLIVEPGYISSEHVKPKRPTSAAPRYLGTPALVVATAVFFMMASMFSRR